MDREEIIRQTRQYARKMLENDATGHDWWHVYRVWKAAVFIGKKEKADLFVVQLAALLHDIADWKFHQGDDSIGPEMAREWLKGLNVDKDAIEHVAEIVQEISFKGAYASSKMRTKEGMVVQDADRLDAMGAIGIARAFAYSGFKGRQIYNPDIKPEKHESFDEYKKSKGTAINHFYEKLLLLKDLMNTEAARKIAEERHKFMEQYLGRFLDEWNSKYLYYKDNK